MKKHLLFIFNIFIVLTVLTSCAQNIDEDNLPYTPRSKYTIMLYGAGGGDLDDYLLQSLSQIESYFPVNNINQNQIHITAQFNMSSPCVSPVTGQTIDYQQEGSEYKGTMRWYLSQNGWVKTDNISEVQVLHNPNTLTDFINYSKTKYPAEKYILILKNHGYCFDIREQPIDSEDFSRNARGVIYDNNGGNITKPLSIFGIDEGIKNSGLKFELIYFDCCLMGQIEMLYQIRNRTNYVLSSSNPGFAATNYGYFLDSLVTKNTIPLAMTEYINKFIDYWDAITGANNQNQTFGMDMTLTDMSKIEAFANSFTDVKKRIIEIFNDPSLPSEQRQLIFTIFKPTWQQVELAKDPEMINYLTTKGYKPAFEYGKMYYYDLNVQKYTDPNTNKVDYYFESCSDVNIKVFFSEIGQMDGFLQNLVNKANKDLNNMIIASKNEKYPEYVIKCGPSLGLTFIKKSDYEKDWFEATKAQETKVGTEKYPTVKSCYEQLDWFKKTRWGEVFDLYITE